MCEIPLFQHEKENVSTPPGLSIAFFPPFPDHQLSLIAELSVVLRFYTAASILTRQPADTILAPITQRAFQGGRASALLSPRLLIVVGVKCSQKARLDSNVPTSARPWLNVLPPFRWSSHLCNCI